MQQSVKVVAVLAANQALTSLLTAVLAATPGLRVRSFDSELALTIYMRLSPVDVLVCDFDCETAPAARLAQILRTDESLADQDLQIIALASNVDECVKRTSIASGIDEVIVKPMSPKYLLERVISRLRQTSMQVAGGTYRGPERRGRVVTAPPIGIPFGGRNDNVVSLFKDRRLPLN